MTFLDYLIFITFFILKVIQKTEAGIAGTADVKTLILKCEDFRTIRFTFLKSKPNGHIFLETKFHIIDEVILNLFFSKFDTRSHFLK